MVHIGDLPEDLLLHLLSLVPGRDLIRNCRLVCSQWRDLVDVPTVWRRKCQWEGFLPRGQDRSVPNWKMFYFLCLKKRNLIKNPAAEAGLKHWVTIVHKDDEWNIKDLPGVDGREFPLPHVQKCFVTPLYWRSTKEQYIDLRKEGYWAELMDETKPDIVVKDWYIARYASGCRYTLTVQLLAENSMILETFEVPKEVIRQWNDAEWHEITHTFHNYPSGVRYIHFKHGSRGAKFRLNRYGVCVTNSGVTIGPEMAPRVGKETAPLTSSVLFGALGSNLEALTGRSAGFIPDNA
ncbi:F-box only protein 44-like [Heteronotia binoei]|uniref:F-box only protein 44-like n=1 Tax=Heteronotia binoei TaxID=13085 RepID=UPI002931C27A|nr:F-box only protein 44-like [Heteronotia binoei]